ncbi:MAG: hypothetical protein KAU20_02355 [Nanoarchaeota archaeon]|nr:hypothetical protein [Nanoarchaeota archaeon]
MQNFDKYTEEMRQFEKSSLFSKHYTRLIKGIKTRTQDEPVTSREIEKRLNLSGSQIRRLIQHGRRNGVQIASGDQGYYIAENYEQLLGTIQHLKERRNSLHYTIVKMREGSGQIKQMEMFV